MKSDLPTSGFTLVELTVVLIIVSLLLGGLLIPLSAQQDIRQQAEAEKQLLEIRDALVGYAQIHGRLPCPAISAANGLERRDKPPSGGPTLWCNKQNLAVPAASELDSTVYGFLPWAELGVRSTDPWGRLIRYRVSTEFVQNPTAGSYPAITIAPPTPTAAQLKIQDHNAVGGVTDLTNDNPREVVFVVLSHGKNGYHGTQLDGSAGPSDAGVNNPDEDQNDDAMELPGRTAFINRSHTPATAPTVGAFDDVVVWVPRSVLINRLVAAGKI